MQRKIGNMKKNICVLLLVFLSFSQQDWASGESLTTDENIPWTDNDATYEAIYDETDESLGESQSRDEDDCCNENENMNEGMNESQDKTIVYDLQPTTLEDVQMMIDMYNTAVREMEEVKRTDEVIQRIKPHWEFEVADQLMPEGYSCEQVKDDIDFGAEYYTFFVLETSSSTTWDGSVAAAISGGGTLEDPYLIYTAAELAFVARQVNNGISGYGTAEYKLMSDIDLAGRAWTPIGIGGGMSGASGSRLLEDTIIELMRVEYAFKGVFDGNGKMITGLRSFAARSTGLSGGADVARGFFGAIESATIKNLTIKGAAINQTSAQGGGALGILIGFAVNDVSGTGRDIYINNCTVMNSSLTSGSNTYNNTGMGALIGYLAVENVDAHVIVENCTIYDTIVTSSGNSFNGGVAAGIGYIRNIGTSSSNTVTDGKLEITNCELTDVRVNSRSDHTAGMVGYVLMQYNKAFTLEMNHISTLNLSLTRTQEAHYNFGGLLGYFHSKDSGSNHLLIEDIQMDYTNFTSAYYDSRQTGGLVGYWHSERGSYDNCDISNIRIMDLSSNSTSSGAGSRRHGGIVGYCRFYDSDYGRFNVGGVEISDVMISTNGTTSGQIGAVAGDWEAENSSGSIFTISSVNASGLQFSTSNTSSYYIGGVLGRWYSHRSGAAAYKEDKHSLQVDDVMIDGLEIYTTGDSNYAKGGIIGLFYTYYSGGVNGRINNCKVLNASIYSGGASSYDNGGIIGHILITSSGSVSFDIDNCHTDCALINNARYGYSSGGIAGFVSINGTAGVNSDNFKGTITNSTTAGDISGTTTSGYYYGGIIGYLIQNGYAFGSVFLIENCSASGDVSSASYYIGGVAGYIENTSGTQSNPSQTIVRNCYATGNIYGRAAGRGALSTNAGGFAGHVHAGNNLPSDTILIENCYAAGDVSITAAGGINAGGFIGRPSKNVTIRDCYATGDVYCTGIAAGGFVGFVEGERVVLAPARDEHVTIINCYSTGNVVGGSYDVGGFAGRVQWGYLTNCYSLGSAHSTATGTSLCYVGGFVGRIESIGGVLTNCYSTGYISSSASVSSSYNQMGGFAGRIEDTTTASNPINHITMNDCYYDTTTSGTTTGLGRIGGTVSLNAEFTVTYSGRTTGTITKTSVRGISTSGMIQASTFGYWGIENNVYAPDTMRIQTTNSPWYIDDNITYPYLYFQSDGFNTDKDVEGRLDPDSTGDGYQNNRAITPERTNYNLMELNHSAGNWSTSAAAHKRTDYTIADLEAHTVQYKAKTGGAVRAYFSYLYGKSAEDYNNKDYKWYFDNSGQVVIPSSGTYTHSEGTFYSLGSVSDTDIVAFENGAGAIKTSKRPRWNEEDQETYTFVGEEYVYMIEVRNYSTEGDFNAVVVRDPLSAGVTMVGGTLKISWDGGITYIDIPYDDGRADALYYTYEKQTSGEYRGRYMLTIYLGDIPKVYYDNNTLVFSEVFIQYTAFIGKEAATDFTDINWRSFENIRNRAYVSGTMVYDYQSTDITLVADDRNTDPVYYRYSVSYNDNLDDNNTSDMTDLEIHGGYYLTDGLEEHLVLHETDSLLGFSRYGYSFIGWVLIDEDGYVEQIYQPGETFYVTRDSVLYAQWKKNPVFEFYKVSALDDSIMLEGAEFRLYEYAGDHQPDGLIDLEMPGLDWILVGSVEITDSDGRITFELPRISVDTYYQLVETKAPVNYTLPSGQWLIKIDGNIDDITYEIAKINGIDGLAPPAFKIQEGGGLLLTNIPVNELPVMGSGGSMGYVRFGIVLMLISVIIGFIQVSVYRHKKKHSVKERV